MSFSDLFGTGEHTKNLGHFAAIVNLAAVDGEINDEEKVVLESLARKLDIHDSEVKEVMKSPEKFPITPPHTTEKRLERLYDLLTIIFADHDMDEQEEFLLKRYAVGLGFSSQTSKQIIERSIKILGKRLSFDDYQYLLDRK
ncbi:TerB family tellurite resistance protein [Mesonia aestuariivivens]|uniref:TerB family tellurite resistance protein n=1 Tax=Mesonia aestuariivivens TaxID=2796128 RepID=A0ABS6VXL0_9FLAO|nr:TerB family tellurite resistance protein [Mesonia aestuariivivens]MBW2960320.1 TerB family tellurite resistance protein [Mesonia aestuariivivens]